MSDTDDANDYNEQSDGDVGYKILFEPGTISTNEDVSNDLVDGYEDEGLRYNAEILPYYGPGTESRAKSWQDPVKSDTAKGLRKLYDEDCVLLDSLVHNGQSTYNLNTVNQQSGYSIPLHILSAVPGHTIKRIAVMRTAQTKREIDVVVSCKLAPCPYHTKLPGRQTFLYNLRRAIDSIECTNYLPREFIIEVAKCDDVEGDAPPLCVGNQISVGELARTNISLSTPRGQYTVPTEAPKFRFRESCGIGSTLMNNTIVMMYPNVEQYMVSSDKREPKTEQVGFLCCASTSSSASSKGLVRHTAAGVVTRRCTPQLLGHLNRLYDKMDLFSCQCYQLYDKELSDEDNVRFPDGVFCWVEIMGLRTQICSMCVHLIRVTHSGIRDSGPDIYLLHETSDDTLFNISFPIGTLMRKTQSGLWIDSKHQVDDTDLKSLGYGSLLSAAINIVPFLSYVAPTRAALFNIYLNQAVCSPASIYDGTVTLVPEYKEDLLLMSSYLSNCYADRLSSIPGLNLYTIFMNMELTYEDGMVMSVSTARRFKYKAYHKIMINGGSTDIPKVGDMIDPFGKRWWQNMDSGKVVSVECTTRGSFRVIVLRLGAPVNGDKFTTFYGQKGVVTILHDHMMPQIDGRTADLIIGSNSIIKRGTAGQLIEAACSMYVDENMSIGDVGYIPHEVAVLSDYAKRTGQD